MTDHVARSREDCEAKGIAWARAELPTMTEGVSKRAVHQWIEETERAERAAIEAKQLLLAERSTSAAETSSQAAVESAQTSGTSARAAIFSAFVSFAALVVAILAYFRQT
jgi:ferric-dicitrate binding protein FerR (iron transport regulator)